MPRLCFLLIPVSLFSILTVFGQSPNIRWERRYEAEKAEQIFHSAVETVKGDILVAGEISGIHAENGRQALLMVIDTGGTLIMPRDYGGAEDDAAHSIVQGPDQSYFLGGARGNNGWIWQVDREGTQLWELVIPDTEGQTSVLDLTWDQVGEVLFWVGESAEQGIFGAVSAEGKELWQKTIRHSEPLQLNKILQDPKGNLFLLGRSPQDSPRQCFSWLQSYNTTGQVRWPTARLFTGIEPADLIFDPDHQSLWINGTDWSSQRGDLFLLELDVEGKEKGPVKTYGGKMEDQGSALVKTWNGHFYTAGLGLSALRRGAKYPRIWLNHLDADGTEIWSDAAYFGKDQRNLSTDLIELRNGDLLAVGASVDRGGRYDGWLLCLEGSEVPSSSKRPELAISALQLQGGNGDDVIDAGEEVFLRAMVKNTGRSIAVGLQGRLNLESDNAAIQFEEIKNLGGLRSEGESQLMFRIKAEEALGDGMARFQLSIQAENGQVVTNRSLETQTKRWLRTELTIDGNRLSPDEKIRPGEQYTLEVYVKNTGETTIENAKVNFLLPKGITADSPIGQLLPMLPPGAPGPAYLNFTVDPNFRGRGLDIKLFLEDTLLSYRLNETLSFEVATPVISTANSVMFTWIRPIRDSMQLLEREFDICVRAISKSVSFEKEDFTIWVNGDDLKNREGEKYRKVSLQTIRNRQEQVEYELKAVIPLEEGWNEVQVEYRKNGTRSTSPSHFFYSGAKPNLFVLSIGIPFEDLKYTAKDAREFAEALRLQEGLLYNKVNTLLLNTEEQTRSQALKTAISDLRLRHENGEITQYDVIALYISSHGETMRWRNGDQEFRIIASDYDKNRPEITTLDFQDDIIRVLQEIPCKKKVFVDACRPEAQFLSQPMDGARSPVSRPPEEEVLFKLADARESLQYLFSCSPGERSFEDDAWENGAFTEALLEALNNEKVQIDGENVQADLDEDAYLSMGELYEFVKRRVPQLVQSVKQTLQQPYLKSLSDDQQLRFLRIGEQK